MRRAVVMLVLVFAGCAAAPLSTSFQALQRLQLRERAGIYPPDWDVVGDSHKANYEHLKAWAIKEGFTVLPAPIGRKNLLGHVQFGGAIGWVVLVDEDLSPDGRLYTLAHELGHVYGPRRLDYEQAETVAEVIAASVCERVGLDVWPQTASYLAAHAEYETQTRVMQLYGKQVDKAVAMIASAAQ